MDSLESMTPWESCFLYCS